MKEIQELFMRRALLLAKKGVGTTRPNPMVGCVIEKDEKIIGEGWHYKSGGPHAEVVAINSVKNPPEFNKSTLYVTLEPCSHHGKTSPCTDLIIQKKIPRVVIGTQDSYEKVNRTGIKKLKSAGIKVIESVLEEDCRILNRRFLNFHEKKRPYIVLKWAQSNDGFMDVLPHQKNTGEIFWISNVYSRQLTHLWRTQEEALLIGTQTARNDNPQLNARHWYGNNPWRVLLDKNLRLPCSLNIYDQQQPTLIFTEETPPENKNKTRFIQTLFNERFLENMLKNIYDLNVQSLMVEGGKKTLESFIEKKLWDESRIFIAGKNLKNGLNAPMVQGKIWRQRTIDNDRLLILIPDGAK
ncbi:bifunctional diaminohydroxyphosphoribosylaminopyrimidine deaminase/5-amino-6-(5-phosphoribosylamino)uracil reductase RibD [Bacteroidetes bacterium endosymbiont of Geopemphigus sp.]|uniref:bifunctional diaminohydroxyphosphoribosylaminopyrimidine deaminase/5-amino-6-(5-phosphoribosylamino)uracil reductase RibD n=1 Tax=Bacteroidetes bacterium endosymbiont of Geopemphigus sp. TaxID=2047937 RepID=UPI000CD10421|nr:bifunctional diaminohydroxyphosphoribosylaminopyrimidine deaminase/5-amino-6-(5-phosphoribosylamino)uracil reductase RibD [Bacteroidetes bacterium endosymbiont of Geopemphigus sp.]